MCANDEAEENAEEWDASALLLEDAISKAANDERNAANRSTTAAGT
jgi:hypothetical protein